MSLESILEANTAAVKELTAALIGAKNAGASTAAKPAATPPKPAAAPVAAKPKSTMEQVTKMAVRVKLEMGEEQAKAKILEVGGGSLKEMPPSKWDQFIRECEEMLAAFAAGEQAPEEDASGL